MNWVMIFSVLTGFFAICTAIAQSIKDKESDKERMADKNEIIQLQKANNDTLNQINNLQAELILSNKKLVGANERIEQLNVHQLNYLSGGNSFPYIDILKVLDNSNEENISFALNKLGEFPLYNINITYWYPDDFREHRPDGRATIEALDKYNSVRLGDIFQNGSSIFGNMFKIANNGIIKVNFSINSKNGSFSEVLKIYKKDQIICCAYKVNTITNGKSKSKILKQYVDKDFPTNKDGNVDWN